MSASPLLLLSVSIKLISTHWETIKHTVIPATYIESSLHKYRIGSKLIHLLKHFQEKLQSTIYIFVAVFIISYNFSSVRSFYMNASMHTAHKTSHHSRDT
jgi:hypothetical protein